MPRIARLGRMIAPTSGWKCSSNSCKPMKYHGALAGLGDTSGLAMPSSGAGTSMAKTNSRAKAPMAKTNSRRTRCGIVVTRSDLWLLHFDPIFWAGSIRHLCGRARSGTHQPEDHQRDERDVHGIKIEQGVRADFGTAENAVDRASCR